MPTDEDETSSLTESAKALSEAGGSNLPAGGWGTLVGLLGCVALLVTSHQAVPTRDVAEAVVVVTTPSADPTEPTDVGFATVSAQVKREGDKPVTASVALWQDGAEGAASNTDEAGWARFTKVPLGSWTLVVEADGWSRQDLQFDLNADEHLVRSITLTEKSAPLSGRVLSASGEPISSARVRLRRKGTVASVPWEVLTDDEGRYSVNTMGGGSYVVTFETPGLDRVTKDVTLVVGKATELSAVLEASSVITGRVFALDGSPAATSVVSLAGSGVWPARRLIADAQGRFVFSNVPAGIYELRAHKDDAVSQPREGVNVSAAGSAYVTLRLEKGAVLRGRILDDETDAPIANAEIIVSEEGLSMQPRVARSSVDGRFAVAGLVPRPHLVAIKAEGYIPMPPVRAAAAEVLEVRLKPGATLIGKVLDARNRPVENAQVEVLGLSAAGSSAMVQNLTGSADEFQRALFKQQLATGSASRAGELGITNGSVPLLPVAGGPPPLGVTTDALGEFRIDGVPPGEVQVLVQHRLHAATMSETFILVARKTHELELSMKEGAKINGRLVDPRGFPIGNVLIELRAEGEPYPRVELAHEDGTFGFAGALGVVTLTAMPSGQPSARQRLTVEDGSEVSVTLTLETELTQFSGRVFDPRGFPLEQVVVSLRSLNPKTPFEQSTPTQDDGTFHFTAIPPPPYRVEASHPRYAMVRVEPVKDAGTELSVTLVAAGKIFGRVVDADSQEGLPGLQVTLERPERDQQGDVIADTRSGTDGAFGFQRAALGRYRIRVSGSSHLEQTRSVQLKASRSSESVVEVPDIELSRAGALKVTVTDALGDPVRKCTVEVQIDDVSKRSSCNAKGIALLEGLQNGVTSVRVTAEELNQTQEPIEKSARIVASETAELEVRFAARVSADSKPRGAGLSSGVAVLVGIRDGRVQIRKVKKGSQAARKLRSKDIIVSIDGENVFSEAQARSMLSGPRGVSATLSIERSGRRRTVIAPREAYRF